MSTVQAPSRRRRYLWIGGLALLVAGYVVAGPGYDWYINHPHGTPDPRGERMSSLSRLAHDVTPADATAVQIRREPASWDRTTCDGENPGWSAVEVDLTFSALSSPLADLDAAMARVGWRSLPVEGGTALREYEPSSRRYGGYAYLFVHHRPLETWLLELTAQPAEVPNHDCG